MECQEYVSEQGVTVPSRIVQHSSSGLVVPEVNELASLPL
jgi:hypothetical protein